MSTFLFDEFERLSPTAWKQKIQVDLKGADYNETLLWKTNEGIVVKPFYSEKDRNYAQINLPEKGFLICQSIFVDDVSIANKLAKDAIKRGASAIHFTAAKTFHYKKLLTDLIDNDIKLHFDFHFLDTDFVSNISEYCKNVECYFQTDIIGHLAETGNWFESLKSDIDKQQRINKKVGHSICVNASLYQNAGANIVQQLAYALAHTNEYIEIFDESVVDKIHYKFSVGSNYFFEIAKLRAFRILHASLLQYRQIREKRVHVFCQPSIRNKTIYDYNVNMLRTTTETMSAILGGSNTISNISYDSLYNKSNEFGERISRNQLLILQNEAYLKEAQNFADGAYYIESITKQLAEKALATFKQIEKGGGFLAQLKKGNIQNKISESASKEVKSFEKNEITLLGTNKLPNKNDKMKENLEIYPFLKTNISKTLIPPILQKRLSEQYEKNRLEQELS